MSARRVSKDGGMRKVKTQVPTWTVKGNIIILFLGVESRACRISENRAESKTMKKIF